MTFDQFRWYMDGARHARDALLFGIVGIFVLGILFGPLALSQAKKAEAYGADATAGKVLGWVAIGWFCLTVLFFIGYFALFFIIFSQALHRQGA